MKATLKFNLPEERQEHLRAVKATDLCSILWDMDQWFRDEIKHNNKEHLQEARDKLGEFMYDNGINLNEIYS